MVFLIKIIQPFDSIIYKKCIDNMNVNSHKGNSWMDSKLTPMDFLTNKLNEEYAEFVLSIIGKNDYSIESEGADLINIISMIIRRTRL